MGYVVRQTLPTESSSAPRIVTSVINLKTVVSSADPKNGSKSSSQVLSSDPSYNREKPIVHSTKKVCIHSDNGGLLYRWLDFYLFLKS